MFGSKGMNDANAVRGVATDASGNVVFTGPLYGTVDFGGGPLASTSAAGDLYVAKVDSAGKHVWSASYGGGTLQYGNAVVTDSADSLIVAGGYAGDLKLGSVVVYNGGGSGPLGDVFIAKFDKVGHPVWAVPGTAGGKYNFATAMAVDGSDNVVVTGQFLVATAFPGAPAVTSVGGTDIFLAKLGPGGGVAWVKVFGDAAAQGGTGVAVDKQGNVVMAATSASGLNFGGGVLGNDGGSEVYLAKFDPMGNHVWSAHFGGPTTQSRSSVAVDAMGNVFVAGMFSGTIDPGGGPLTAAGAGDFFVAKFDASGAFQWSKQFGDAADQKAILITADTSGGIVLHGHFLGAVDFGGGPLTNAGGETTGGNVFVAKLDTNGNHVWSRGFGDAFPAYAYSIAAASDGSVSVGGQFSGEIDFSGVNPLTNLGNQSGYLARLLLP